MLKTRDKIAVIVTLDMQVNLQYFSKMATESMV